jgi:zinc protease
LDVLNKYVQAFIGDKNIAIVLTAPEKEGVTLPSKADLLTWFNEARKDEISAPKEEASSEPLLRDIPATGKIVSEKPDKKFDATVLTLSNGVKVVVKSTTFKEDEILLSATSPGGSSHFPESEDANIKLFGQISNLGGLGNFSQTDLRKVLAGKNVSVNPSVSLIYEGFSGKSSVKDFETLLQLIYLNFTAPRTDEAAFQSYMTRIKSQLESQEANPEIAFSDTLTETLFVNPIRDKRIRVGDLARVDYKTIMKWRNERFADASDFTFVFTGNLDLEKNKELITKYLGSLPSTKRKESFVRVNENFRPGITQKSFQQQMENIKATIADVYWTTLTPNLKNKLEIDFLQQILRIIYTEKIREDEGGTYGVSVGANISNYPEGLSILQISFQTQPGKEKSLNDIVHKELQNLAASGPRAEDFNKVKEFSLKRQQEQEQENAYWSSTITSFYRHGYDGYSDVVKTMKAITPADIQKKAKDIIDAKNLIEVVMVGVKEK